MELKDLFYQWVPVYIKLPILFLFLFTILTANGIYLGNTIEIYSSLGEYSEPFTQASNALYIGMGLGLMFALRLKQRFSNKELLLLSFSIVLLLNIVCATTENTNLIILSSLAIGVLKIPALIEIYLIWMVVWTKTGDRSRFYPFFYFMALAGLYFVTWIMAVLALDYNWRIAYLWVYILLLSCILLVLIFVENHKLKKRIPFYQIDWIGLFLLASSFMLSDYAIVYGKVEDWFSSQKIILAFILSLLCLLLFIRREISIKRPLFDVSLFKLPNFRLGLFYFIVLGLFLPNTFQSAFAATILKYENITTTELNLYLIPGIFAGAVFCFLWYYKKLDSEVLIAIGFSTFTCYHIMMYFSFANDFAYQDFMIPLAIKGFSIIVLYISIGLFALDKLGPLVTIGAAGMMVLFRSFVGSGTFTAIYGNLIYTKRIEHFESLTMHIDATDYMTSKFASGNHYKFLQEQALLTASKELTGYIVIIGIMVSIFIFVKYSYTNIERAIAK